MNGEIKLKGTYRLVHKRNGKVLSDETVNNLIVNAGRAQLALLAGQSGSLFTYIAVGTSNTAVAVTDTTLTAEIVASGLSRATGTVSRITTTVANDTYQVTKIFTATGAVSVEEIGVLNASSAGTMLSHALSGTKTLANTDTLAVTYTLVFA